MKRWLGVLLLWPAVAAAAGPRIAIVIDDLGYHRQRGEAVIDLPASVSCAIIPSAPHARYLAARAAGKDREILVHMPMEGVHGGPLDAGGIAAGMARPDVEARILAALVALPEARGVNNHMGSGITASRESMEWMMTTLAERRVFFLDSRTTPVSVAEDVAREHGLATGGRDVFLDNERDLHRINDQFNQLLRIARQRGHAIGIGHPYPETIAYLQYVLPLLEQAGIEVVPVSELLSAPAEGEVVVTDEREGESEADGDGAALSEPREPGAGHSSAGGTTDTKTRHSTTPADEPVQGRLAHRQPGARAKARAAD